MSLSRKTVTLGAFLLVCLSAGPAVAVSTVPTDKYVAGQGARFESLAGSRSNLTSLTNGLRTGSEVTLVESTPTGPRTTTFTPATKPMGYGNVTHSLDLANRQLAANGINNPTAAELQAALNGGTVHTANGDVKLQGVLQLRASGMGWGKIAHTIGVHPSSHASAKALAHAATPAAARSSHGGVTTAAGNGNVSVSNRGQGSGRSGVVTAAGGSASTAGSSHGQGAGIQTAAGGGMGGGQGHAYGHAGK